MAGFDVAKTKYSGSCKYYDTKYGMSMLVLVAKIEYSWGVY